MFTTAITLFNGFAQGNVGIGTNTPNASSILDINSNNKGVLFPNVALTGINAATPLTSPATGLVVWNTTTGSGLTPGYYYNAGTPSSPNWTRVANGSVQTPSLSNTKVWIGNTSNIATEQTIGGDATLNNIGTLTIANDAITTPKILNNAVTIAKLPSGASGTTFLRGDGTWQTPINTTYSAGTGLNLSGYTFNLSNAGTAGTYTKVTTNAQGQVTSGTTLSASDIPNLSGNYVDLTTNQTAAGNKTWSNIGTFSAGATFNTANAIAASGAQFYNNQTGVSQILLNSGGANWGNIQNDAAGVWSLGYGATGTNALKTPVLSWTTNNRIGIGTIAPAENLHVVGNILSSNLAGTGNRPVYADANGVLKTGSTNSDNSQWSIASNLSSSPDDISATWTTSTDEGQWGATMPFSIRIDGVDYNTVSMSTNGAIIFGSTTATLTYTNTCLPTSSVSTPTLFWYWDDMQTRYRWVSQGTSPNRTFVIDFDSNYYNTGDDVDGVVQIHESGLIQVSYRVADPNTNGQSATIGFQRAGGSSAIAHPISCNAKIMDDNRLPEEWSVSPVR